MTAKTPQFGHDTMTCPCLVYVRGPRGPSPQIWYDPLVNADGVVTVAPEGIVVIGEPVQLPPRVNGRPDWTPDEAHELVRRNAA